MRRAESIWAAAARELSAELELLRPRPPRSNLAASEPPPPATAVPLPPRATTSHAIIRPGDAPPERPIWGQRRFASAVACGFVPIGEAMTRSRSTPTLRPIEPLQPSGGASSPPSPPGEDLPWMLARSMRSIDALASAAPPAPPADKPSPPSGTNAATGQAPPPPNKRPPAVKPFVFVLERGGRSAPRVASGLFSTSSPPDLWTPSGGNVHSKYRNCAPLLGPRTWDMDPRLPPVVPRTEISLEWGVPPRFPVREAPPATPDRLDAPNDTRHHRTKQFDLVPVRAHELLAGRLLQSRVCKLTYIPARLRCRRCSCRRRGRPRCALSGGVADGRPK